MLGPGCVVIIFVLVLPILYGADEDYTLGELVSCIKDVLVNQCIERQ